MITKEPRSGLPMSGSNKSGGISGALMTATVARFALRTASLDRRSEPGIHGRRPPAGHERHGIGRHRHHRR
jgi:hypothetical protein